MKTEINASYVLVDYTWAVLEANAPKTWNKDNYEGLVPIVPLNEEPELDEYSAPHIVYGYVDDATGSNDWESSGSMTLVVYDQNFRRLSETMTILKATFERLDETARDVNKFSSNYKPEGTTEFPYIGIRFGSISIGFVEGGTPESGEGNRQSALINITYTYFVDYDVVTDI